MLSQKDDINPNWFLLLADFGYVHRHLNDWTHPGSALICTVPAKVLNKAMKAKGEGDEMTVKQS